MRSVLRSTKGPLGWRLHPLSLAEADEVHAPSGHDAGGWQVNFPITAREVVVCSRVTRGIRGRRGLCPLSQLTCRRTTKPGARIEPWAGLLDNGQDQPSAKVEPVWVRTGDHGTSSLNCHTFQKVGCTTDVVTQSGKSVHLG